MNNNPRNAPWLAILALAAWMVYVVACAMYQPAISPDGTKILYLSPADEQKNNRADLMIYDRIAGTTRQLMECEIKEGMLAAQWTPDGKEVVVVSAQGVKVMSLDGRTPMRRFELPGGLDKETTYLYAPPIVGKYQYFGGEFLYRLDFNTGAVVSSTNQSKPPLLIGNNGHVFYWSPEEGAFGTLDLETLAPKLLLKVSAGTDNDKLPFVALSPDESLLAISVEDGKKIRLYRNNKMFREITLETAVHPYKTSFMLWAPRRQVLYAVYSYPFKVENESRTQLGLLEVDLERDLIREIPIVLTEDSDEKGLALRPVISPDGKLMYVASFVVEKNGRGLYTIDLTSPNRDLKKVSMKLIK
ncbi:MAG: hypothetical protein WCO56_01565 [Verrucomicrobiota bacterium]